MADAGSLRDGAPPEFVIDAYNDIAMNESLQQLRVNIAGRQKFQRVFVRPGVGGRGTTKVYDPATDRPSDVSPELKPIFKTTREELIPNADLIEVLVVGLFLLDKPLQYAARGSGAIKTGEKPVKRPQVILEEPDNIGRIVVLVTSHIKSGISGYYGLVRPVSGISTIRRLNAGSAFYFKEFWSDGCSKMNLKFRQSEIARALRFAAAKDKEEPEKARVSVGSAKDEKRKALKTLKVTNHSNAGTLLRLTANAWAASHNPDFLTVMEQTLNDLLPSLTDKPLSGSDGVDAFFDTTTSFSIEKSDNMLSELESYHDEFPTLDRQLVVKIHASLVALGRLEEVPRRSLPLFLETVHSCINNDDGKSTVDFHVNICVDFIVIAEQYQ